jgi:hypothetical protein
MDLGHILRIDAQSGLITTVAGNGSSTFSGDGGPATSAGLHSPMDVAVDASGNLFIADTYNQRIRRVDTAGTITTVAGNGTAGYNGDGIAATSAELNHPVAVALDSFGNLFISDSGRLRLVDFTGTITTVWLGAPDGLTSAEPPAQAKPHRAAHEAKTGVAEYEGFTAKQVPQLLRRADRDAGAGRYEAAKREYEIVLKFEPGNMGAKDGLHKLSSENE